MRKITKEELKEIIEKHRKWLNNEAGGQRADLSYTNMSGADMSDANMRGANMGNANMCYADMSDADMSYADMRGADMSDADMCDANLRGAKTDKRYTQTSCIGSRKSSTTYCFEDDTIFCGCFKGTLKEFEDKIHKTYPDKKNIHRIEYDAFIGMISNIKKAEGVEG